MTQEEEIIQGITRGGLDASLRSVRFTLRVYVSLWLSTSGFGPQKVFRPEGFNMTTY